MLSSLFTIFMNRNYVTNKMWNSTKLRAITYNIKIYVLYKGRDYSELRAIYVLYKDRDYSELRAIYVLYKDRDYTELRAIT